VIRSRHVVKLTLGAIVALAGSGCPAPCDGSANRCTSGVFGAAAINCELLAWDAGGPCDLGETIRTCETGDTCTSAPRDDAGFFPGTLAGAATTNIAACGNWLTGDAGP
jgi:hypothetical protein